MESIKKDLLKSQNPKLMKKRMLYAMLISMGRSCTVKQSDESIQPGIIHTLCKNGIKICGNPNNVRIPIEKVVSVHCAGIQMLSKNKFKTDHEISKQSRAQKRTLQQWEGEDSSNLNFDVKEYKVWDQFETNKQKFGVVSTYDENLYTTPVPKLSELTEEQVLRAKIVEKELGVCSVEKEENEMDEEAQFGAVLGSGRYESSKKDSAKKPKKKAEDSKAEAFVSKKFVNHKKNLQQSLNLLLQESKEKEQTQCTSILGLYLNGWNNIFKNK